MKQILIIGGGAAGMMAAAFAAKDNTEVFLLEKNEKLGKKIYITGKGRCNVTNNCTDDTFFASVVSNPRFLYSAYYSFTSQDAMAFFEEAGTALKTERGNRVFPVSDHSSDIIKALERTLKRKHVHIFLNTEVKEILISDGHVTGVRAMISADNAGGGGQERIFPGNAVIVATGGLSYPSTGSTGDGFLFAKKLGHTVKDLSPSLTAMTVRENYIRELKGLSLRNTALFVRQNGKELYRDFGEMLFTGEGVSGPMILSASAYTARFLKKGPLDCEIDLKPALTDEMLDARLLREFEPFPNKQLKNVIGVLYPSSLTPVILRLSEISPEKKICNITREERMRLIHTTRHFPFTITGTAGYNEAVITKGGVNVKEVNPSTMESKLVKGLFFAGEILDLDAVTGGFNLQIAWCTGHQAALACTEE